MRQIMLFVKYPDGKSETLDMVSSEGISKKLWFRQIESLMIEFKMK